MTGHVHLGLAAFVSFLLMLGLANIIMRILAGHLTLSDTPLLHVLGEALGFAY